MIDCEKCKYYHDNCDAKFRCRIDIDQIKADYLDEIEKLLLDRFTCDDLRTDWTNADIRETIHFELEKLKEQSNDTD